MAERDRILASLRVWVATAWADGTIADPERAALRRLIGYAQISEAEKAEAQTWLDSPINLEVGDLHELSLVRRQFIYRVAAALTRVDDNVDSAERALLDKLRAALDVDPGEAAEPDPE
ncbi:hypothetical protein [Enhygromyxa salina]|uniref:Tellurite resistance protein TerB n=1 Tax=Enhygromyxa salina TaxID=215803 RepID=A0A2S9Y610_9BACT|nr:hypothetical protein [Enhygromyxa salina]PRQ00525.1 hypothetical protein ENSA7_60190 [Enhygromyxa salina]